MGQVQGALARPWEIIMAMLHNPNLACFLLPFCVSDTSIQTGGISSSSTGFSFLGNMLPRSCTKVILLL